MAESINNRCGGIIKGFTVKSYRSRANEGIYGYSATAESAANIATGIKNI